jgi:hypothetical protein
MDHITVVEDTFKCKIGPQSFTRLWSYYLSSNNNLYGS